MKNNETNSFGDDFSFCRDFIEGEYNFKMWFDDYNNMSSERKENISKLLAEQVSVTLENSQNGDYLADSLLPGVIRFCNRANESEKKYMRSVLLKWRTTGDDKERRHKAELFKKALNTLNHDRGNNKKQVKAVSDDLLNNALSRISYTKSSSLNKALNVYNGFEETYSEMKASVKQRKLINSKAEETRERATMMKRALDTYGIDKPFSLDGTVNSDGTVNLDSDINLVDGYDSWWHTIKRFDNGDERREKVTPIYKFTSKDTIEVIGATISEYDRVRSALGGDMSSPSRKVKEIGLAEYKKMIADRQQFRASKKKELNR